MSARSPLDDYNYRPFNLIQRLQDRHGGVDPSKGFDGFFSFDYMGRAEFEFGTVPAALKSMRQRKKRHPFDYEMRSVHVPAYSQSWGPKPLSWAGGPVRFWFVSREPLGDRVAALEAVLEDEYRMTKEPTRIHQIVAGYTESDVVAWWSLTDDIAWALDEPHAKLLAQAFNTRRQASGA